MEEVTKSIAVIGGGAAGMIAAIFAARNGHQVTLYERNEKLGKKLYITGKGRCNITNACEMDKLFSNMVSNEKFLYSGFYSFTNLDVMNFFEELGLIIKVERGERVFPASDKSSEVIHVLQNELRRQNVSLVFGKRVTDVVTEGTSCTGVIVAGKSYKYDAVIVATGGLSYSSTGSTGDGYSMAKAVGHTVTDLMPALVPLETKEKDATSMQGLALKNVEVSYWGMRKNKKCLLYSEFGEMLFTHFGVSGPLVLSGSSYIVPHLKNGPVQMTIDCKPALSKEQLEERILRDFDKAKNCCFKNAIGQLLPRTMIPVFLERTGIDKEKQVNLITKEERKAMVELLKAFPFTITKTRDYNEAIITKGGIKVNEINPSTMESKKISGLYFAGEVLDLDGLTGGFNLQIAWSTGYLAGVNAAQDLV